MISNNQWKVIEERLGGCYGTVKFDLKGTKVGLGKRLISENKLAIVIFIDGELQIGDGFKSNGESVDPLIEKLWRKRSKALWSPARKAKITKEFSKKLIKEVFTSIDSVRVWYVPYFPKFGALQRQYKKIEGLSLIED